MVYEPREDSELLADIVTRYARGRALDIGTGSGILARAAYDKGCTVTAIDVNPEAVKRLRGAPFRVVRTDSIDAVRGTFDTLICNPPYLPNDPGIEDPALYGGPKGYEYIVRVLAQAQRKLAPGGQFLFLISSLTKPAIVEKELARLGYTWEIVARESLFMEQLLVYRATLLFDEPAEKIGEGWRSVVYAIKNGRVAVKRSTPERAHKEGVLLRAANKAGVGPKLLRVREGDVHMQRVHGERLDAWYTRERDAQVLRRAFAQCYALDRAGIRKRELNRPGTNVLVTPRRQVVFLDFERSVFVKPGLFAGNVTQFAGWTATVLRKNIRAQAMAYAKQPSMKTYRALLRALSL